MPTIKELINNYYNKPREKKREIGRYYASELWGIYKGYITPRKFFEQRQIDKQGQANMFRGSAMEEMLAKVLFAENEFFEQQHRYELEISSGIFISGKTDFEWRDKIIETKCPDKEIHGIPDKYKFQMEFYHRASGKPVYLGIFYKNSPEIIKFFPYKPSDETWSSIEKTVIKFNEKLKKLCLK
jgi:hypothetical protein